MKKSLMALAVLGVCAGTASAQSSVSIYGIVDASVARFDNGADSVTRLDSGRNAASRLGFRGAEDLGGGLKATFLIETGFDVSTGGFADGVAGFNRLSYVGLESSNWGAVRLGRQDSPMRTALNVIDPFLNQGMAGSIDYFGYSTAAGGSTTPERVSNQLTYLSPNFSGFSGSVAYNFGETAGSMRPNRGYAGQVGFASGPLNIQAAYGNQNETAVGVDQDAKNALVGATYDFGMLKLHGGYKQTKVENRLLGNDLAKVDSYLVGLTLPFGAHRIRGSYIRNDVKTANGTTATDADSQIYALSYTYSLSKRTTLYATYVKANNDSNADMGVVRGGTLGQNANGIAIGMQHNF